MRNVKHTAHDLRNSLTVMESLLNKLTRISTCETSQSEELVYSVTSLSVALESAKELAKELTAESADEGFDGIGALPTRHLAEYLGTEILPMLSRLYEIPIGLTVGPDLDCEVVASLINCRCIAENLVANAMHAGATRVTVAIGVNAHTVEVVFRDNGRGMTEEQVRGLGFGFTTKTDAMHGQGFRIVRKLASDVGGLVSPPKSIPGFGTEITVTLMRVGAAALCLRGPLQRCD